MKRRMWKPPLSPAAVRRIRARGQRANRPDWVAKANLVVSSLLTLGLLAVAAGQWRTSEKQTEIADSLKTLEYARSGAKFEFQISRESVVFRATELDQRIRLPSSITVTPVSGVRSMGDLNTEIVLIVEAQGDPDYCQVFVRGLYDGKGRTVVVRPDTGADFRKLISEFGRAGLQVSAPRYNVVVTYADILEQLKMKQFSFISEDPFEESVTPLDHPILYSGRRSNGEGFYFDEPGLPEVRCPHLAAKLNAVVRATGAPPDRDRIDSAISSDLKSRGLDLP